MPAKAQPLVYPDNTPAMVITLREMKPDIPGFWKPYLFCQAQFTAFDADGNIMRRNVRPEYQSLMITRMTYMHADDIPTSTQVFHETQGPLRPWTMRNMIASCDRIDRILNDCLRRDMPSFPSQIQQICKRLGINTVIVERSNLRHHSHGNLDHAIAEIAEITYQWESQIAA